MESKNYANQLATFKIAAVYFPLLRLFYFMTNYEKAEFYRLNAEAWLLFYQSFHKTTEAIMNCRSVITDMQGELIKAGLSNPNNQKLKATQQRIDMLNENLEILETLNNKCVLQQKQLKEYKEKILQLENDLEELRRQEREGLEV